VSAAEPRRSICLAGSGSFAVDVAEWAAAAGWEVAGLIELRDERRVGSSVEGHVVLAAQSPAHAAQAPRAGSGVAAVAAGGSRRAHWLALQPHGWLAGTIVHPHAWVSPTARLAPGCVVGPGAVIGAGCSIAEHTLVSRGALVGHHVSVGAFVSLLPGVNLASGVVVGDEATVGMSAAIVDHTSVGAGARIAAGALVLQDVAAGVRVQGVPARRFTA
jgi:UDP-perosamine 4-acetyltransferase